MNDMIWAYLIHLGSNMWQDADSPGIGEPFTDSSVYRDYLLCDRDIWKKVVDFLPTQGVNMLLIDLGEGIEYQSHPELAVKGSWTREELKAELARIRAMGLEPVPKLNFSACHDAWLGEYARMLSTARYYEVVRNLIDEVCELFDRPRFFHLGMDEESMDNQLRAGIAVIRGDKLWWKDFHYLCACCERNGARPWIWSDYYWHKPDQFRKNMPKSVLQSNWRYESLEPRDAGGKYPQPGYQAYVDLNDLGYDQVPTGSTIAFYGNIEQTVRLALENNFDRRHLLGFMTAPWIFTTPYHYYGLLNDAARLGSARKLYGNRF